MMWSCQQSTNISISEGDNYLKLYAWQASMASLVANLNTVDPEDFQDQEESGEVGTQEMNKGMDMDADAEEDMLEQGGVESLRTKFKTLEKDCLPADVKQLLPEQQQAYKIVNWHLNETLMGNSPQQLLMIIPGEGGVSKLKMIQMITQNFHQRGVGHLLAKSAYTGIAASIIDGKMLHVICQIPINGHNRLRKASQKLAEFW